MNSLVPGIWCSIIKTRRSLHDRCNHLSIIVLTSIYVCWRGASCVLIMSYFSIDVGIMNVLCILFFFNLFLLLAFSLGFILFNHVWQTTGRVRSVAGDPVNGFQICYHTAINLRKMNSMNLNVIIIHSYVGPLSLKEVNAINTEFLACNYIKQCDPNTHLCPTFY